MPNQSTTLCYGLKFSFCFSSFLVDYSLWNALVSNVCISISDRITHIRIFPALCNWGLGCLTPSNPEIILYYKYVNDIIFCLSIAQISVHYPHLSRIHLSNFFFMLFATVAALVQLFFFGWWRDWFFIDSWIQVMSLTVMSSDYDKHLGENLCSRDAHNSLINSNSS